MRLNQFLALRTLLSRRAADKVISEGRVKVNGEVASLGQTVTETDSIAFDNKKITQSVETLTIIFNKPVGYVCSRAGQGSKTIYDLLPKNLHHLNAVGRLDKDSSGLLLLTNDGNLANVLTHPRYQKEKVYEVEIDKPLEIKDKALLEKGVKVEDYISRLRLSKNENCKMKIVNCCWRIAISQGRNRQIRRTFLALGYKVTGLHRTIFGDFSLGSLNVGSFRKT